MTLPGTVLALRAAAVAVVPGANQPPAADFNALVFSKTLMFRHASITNGIAAIKQLGAENHFHVDATEDASWFTPANLAKYQVVIFLSTSGNILNEEQQAAFKNFIEQGGGLAAIHAAVAGDVATEGKWPWYGEALCARFTNHSAIVQATVNIEDRKHPSTAPLPEHWVRTDEWYNFIASPRGQARVLASLDETTYKGGTMGKDHPIALVQAGRQGPHLVHGAGAHGSELHGAPVPQTPAGRHPSGGRDQTGEFQTAREVGG